MSRVGKPEKGAHQGPFFAPAWNLGRLTLQPENHPLVMGVINLTPDSFHAPSCSPGVTQATKSALQMAEAGADLLDFGAESSRPGSKPVGPEEELARLLPVLKAVRSETDLPISVDTYRAATARSALDVGADAINDISAGKSDPAMFDLVAERGCGLILMHMQGTPETMQDMPHYESILTEITEWLSHRCREAEETGIEHDRLMVDPGIGFGKTLPHNLALLGNLKHVACGRPLLLGASRKRFIGMITGAEPNERLPGSLAAVAAAWQAGAAMVRVHDVGETLQFLKTLAAINSSTHAESEMLP